MARSGEGSGLTYGKIQLYSGSASIGELKKVLQDILKTHGYPESEADGLSDEAIEEELAEQDEEEAAGEALTKEDREEEEADGEEARPLPPWVRKKDG